MLKPYKLMIYFPRQKQSLQPTLLLNFQSTWSSKAFGSDLIHSAVILRQDESWPNKIQVPIIVNSCNPFHIFAIPQWVEYL